MDRAAFLVLTESSDGIFVYRYDDRGRSVGDTLHASVEDAQHQLSYEYGETDQHWVEIPAETSDVTAFYESRRSE